MMSSAAFPNVALRRPPTRGPAWAARSSVASPRMPANGIIARAAKPKVALWESTTRATTDADTSSAAATTVTRCLTE